jgi:enterochelin esterase-like enzyme
MRKGLLNILALFILGLTLVVTGYWDDVFVFTQHAYFYLTNLASKHSNSQIVSLYFYSNALQSDRKLQLYLPAGYAKGNQRYPVLYLLHGDPGDEQDWLLNGNLQNVLDELIAQQQIPKVIVVFPDGNGPLYQEGQYLNAETMDQALEDYVSFDIVNYVDSHYRTLAQASSRAIGGNSSGGYGAINIALHHPDEFNAVLLESAYFTLSSDKAADLLANNSISIAFNSPLQYIKKVDLPDNFFIYLNFGTNDDDYILQENQAILQQLNKQEIHFIQQQTEGGHGWGIWNENITDALVQTLSRMQVN